jgi:hypothetical protein
LGKAPHIIPAVFFMLSSMFIREFIFCFADIKSIESGNCGFALHCLSGAPSEFIETQSPQSPNYDRCDTVAHWMSCSLLDFVLPFRIWEKMVECADKYVLAGSTGAENQGVLESVGLIENHAYAILAVVYE